MTIILEEGTTKFIKNDFEKGTHYHIYLPDSITELNINGFSKGDIYVAVGSYAEKWCYENFLGQFVKVYSNMWRIKDSFTNKVICKFRDNHDYGLDDNRELEKHIIDLLLENDLLETSYVVENACGEKLYSDDFETAQEGLIEAIKYCTINNLDRDKVAKLTGEQAYNFAKSKGLSYLAFSKVWEELKL